MYSTFHAPKHRTMRGVDDSHDTSCNFLGGAVFYMTVHQKANKYTNEQVRFDLELGDGLVTSKIAANLDFIRSK
jgi:hypothetical protein